MRHLLIGLVRLYRLLLSPWVGGQCRFYPTCSQYTIDALERHGAAAGTYLGAARILRCQPWCRGGHEPVPEVFTWAPWRHRADEMDDLSQANDADVEAPSPQPMHNSASLPGETVPHDSPESSAAVPKSAASLLSSKP